MLSGGVAGGVVGPLRVAVAPTLVGNDYGGGLVSTRAGLDSAGVTIRLFAVLSTIDRYMSKSSR